MEKDLEQKQEITPEITQEVQPERPVINYEAELARKNAELAEMRLKVIQQTVSSTRQRDPNDISTWPDHELKAIRTNGQYSQYHSQIDDILLDRKVEAKMARQIEAQKRVSAEMQLREKYADALNPSSELAVRMEQILQENDLSNTPAGRLVAARLAHAELNQGKNVSDARAAQNEKTRVARVKSQMVDGDRAKSAEVLNPDQKEKDVRNALFNEKSTAHDATGKWMDESGLRDRFKKMWGE